ncbi:hypothetical protein [Pontixanthobacter sp.]|uniref:hypothetical protein n=1 Tax=Pontixanthobacter sp. TaxID=2792078 RepID=UPI003C7B57EF
MKPAILISILACALLTACQPPAADEYSSRGSAANQNEGPSEPIDSPDSTGAFWASAGLAGGVEERIIYGQAGQPPYLGIACETGAARGSAGPANAATVRITRFTPADPEAQALMALIGNGHMARLPVDAAFNGQVWLWEGSYSAASTDLDVLTGPRQIELTIPGAGSVILNPSAKPAALIDRCRRLAATAL